MHDETYRSAYFDPAELARMRGQIAESGFEPDPILGSEARHTFTGLNITMAWPLPARFREAYEGLAADLSALDPGLYVYPFERTHVTVVTAVSFKQYVDPSTETVTLVEEAAGKLGAFLGEATRDMAPFVIDIGPPVLARAAAFFPMLNPTGEIPRLRERAIAYCRGAGGILSNAVAPRVVHATLLRFREAPRDAGRFMAGFERIAAHVRLGEATIDELRVTLEPKPYMTDGVTARVVRLGERGHGWTGSAG